jgi:hypothetical protein
VHQTVAEQGNVLEGWLVEPSLLRFHLLQQLRNLQKFLPQYQISFVVKEPYFQLPAAVEQPLLPLVVHLEAHNYMGCQHS